MASGLFRGSRRRHGLGGHHHARLRRAHTVSPGLADGKGAAFSVNRISTPRTGGFALSRSGPSTRESLTGMSALLLVESGEHVVGDRGSLADDEHGEVFGDSRGESAAVAGALEVAELVDLVGDVPG